MIPEFGLLAADFPEAFLKVFDLRDGTTATVATGVEVPLQPFLGTMGVPTDEPGPVSPFPPHLGGGNVDCRHLIAGSTLWLPVWCDGALFSCGDAHGVQGTAKSASAPSNAQCRRHSGSPSHAERSPDPRSMCPTRSESQARTRARWGSTPI